MSKPESDVRYPVARNHPVLHAAPTFRAIAKGRRRTGLTREEKTENGTLRTEMFYELDVADQDLLLCIFALARSANVTEMIDVDDESHMDIVTPLELDLSKGFADPKCGIPLNNLPALKLEVSRYELLRELQRTDGTKNYKWLKESMNRLSKVGFFYDGKQWAGSFHLLSFVLDKETNLYQIAINPISSHSIWHTKTRYISVQREERHKLNADTARCLHSYLSGVVWAGEGRTLNVDSMIPKVFALYDDETKELEKAKKASGDEKKAILKAIDRRTSKRRKLIHDALLEIGGLERWVVKVSGRGKHMTAKVQRKREF